MKVVRGKRAQLIPSEKGRKWAVGEVWTMGGHHFLCLPSEQAYLCSPQLLSFWLKTGQGEEICRFGCLFDGMTKVLIMLWLSGAW